MVKYTASGVLVFDNGITEDGRQTINIGQITYTLPDFERCYDFVDHTIPVYSLTNELPVKCITGDYISYNITLACSNMADPGNPLTVTVPIPAGFNLIKATSNEGNYNSLTQQWIPTLDLNQKAVLNLILSPIALGNYSQTITFEYDGTYISNSVNIAGSDSGAISSASESLSNYQATLNNMKNGQLYTIIKYSYAYDNNYSGIHNGVKNQRLSVTNGIECFGSRADIQGVWKKEIVTFIYNKDYSLTINWYGQYQAVSTTFEDKWAGLCINEGLNIEYKDSSNLLDNPLSLFDDTGSSDLILQADKQANYVFIFDTYNLLEGDNQFFTGLIATLNNFGIVTSQMNAQIVSDGVKSEIKSEIVNQSGKVEIGELGNIWGLSDKDIENNELELHITIINSTLTQQTFSYSNLRITAYYQDDITAGKTGFTLDGIHSRNFNMFLSEIEAPIGPEYEIGSIELDKHDGIIVTGRTIKEKILKCTLGVMGNTFDEAYQISKRAVQYLTNRKMGDEIIPKQLIFDYDPTVMYEVILNSNIDWKETKTVPVWLIDTMSFLVPSGTSKNTNPTITGAIGKNRGVKNISPIIMAVADGSNPFTLSESVNNQMITINHQIPENKILYIDGDAKTVIASDGTDYTEYLSINCIWFDIPAEYNFTCTGKIQSVLYYEEN